MVSEGPLPVVWCLRDNQLVPHQLSGVKLQGTVTGAHIAAVTDFLRMVAGKPIVLPPTALSEDSDNCINEDKQDSVRRRKMSMQVEVPCVFLTESALNKAKSRNNSSEEKGPLSLNESDIKNKAFDNSSINTFNGLDLKCSSEVKDYLPYIKSCKDKDTEKMNTHTEFFSETSCKKIKRIITLENSIPSLVSSEVQEVQPSHRITRIIDLDDENLFSDKDVTENLTSFQRITRIIDMDKENSFPSMARIIELENEISNERRVSLTNERETGGGLSNECDKGGTVKCKNTLRNTTRFSLDSSCSENSYVNIDSIKSLQDVKREELKDDSRCSEQSFTQRLVRSRFPKKKTSVCSVASSDLDDDVDVIFKSKPKSSQWVSLDWIPPPPKEEASISHVCDKNDFINKWIADQNPHDVGIIPDERRKSLPPKSNELYLQTMRRFSDGLQMCKEDAASDSPATVKSKWHDIVKRHLHILKSDRGFKRQRGSWMRTARRLSGTNANLNSSTESAPLDTYIKLNTMP